MQTKTTIIAFCFLLFGQGAAVAQSHRVVGIFPTYELGLNGKNRWSGSLYSFAALYPWEQTSGSEIYPAQAKIFYVELAAHYALNKAFTISGSYTYERLNPLRDDFRNEHRLWPQVTWKKALGGGTLKNRLRYDLRFIGDRSTSGKVNFEPRLRHLLGYKTPLRHSDLWYFSGYNELFFNTFRKASATYAENWFFAGVGRHLSSRTTLEGGALVISWQRDALNNWLHQYFLQLTLIHQFNSHKQ